MHNRIEPQRSEDTVSYESLLFPRPADALNDAASHPHTSNFVPPTINPRNSTPQPYPQLSEFPRGPSSRPFSFARRIASPRTPRVQNVGPYPSPPDSYKRSGDRTGPTPALARMPSSQPHHARYKGRSKNPSCLAPGVLTKCLQACKLVCVVRIRAFGNYPWLNAVEWYVQGEVWSIGDLRGGSAVDGGSALCIVCF
ncbi:hypothetical protein K458DRAFT_418111 [Lentithecium fluviatile CBS 122367]|uniref:Uncharacterized protein n=1 Tax=Lentithecium fluviatile CBS 122367 TaxID=1168545 RepID=A0A6G1J202_9PLEO|nr:hypothetical protein K458DRAFT_418111 [Lentithecium fluviatile CBS 122367]